MKKGFIHKILLCLLIGLLGFFIVIIQISYGVESPYEGLRINEVQITGGKNHSYQDFIEIYNAGTESIPLKNFSIRKIKSGETFSFSESASIVKVNQDSMLAPGEYFLWACNKEEGFAELVQASVSNASYLSKGYQVGIFDTEKNKVDSVDYGDLPNERGSLSFDEVASVWKWTSQPTAKKENKFDVSEVVIPQEEDVTMGVYLVRLNEILPNPEGKDMGKEFIELYNFGSESVNLTGWSIRDKNLQEKNDSGYIFPQMVIAPKEYFVIYQSDFKFSLNSTHEVVDLLDARGNVVDTMSYKSSKEGISWNFDGSRWRAGSTLTPGAPNYLNGEPSIQKSEVPKKAYEKVYVYFKAKAEDSDGDSVKYRWDFGDGHKSYKQETRHKYDKKGKYTVTLRVDDGREPVEKTYSIKVDSYPKRKLRIISFEANPVGKDSEGEWVRIKNFDKKTVDLIGWSIATGKDKKHLVNHPITVSQDVKKGKEKTVTREMAKITLNNTKGVIELRSPDGKLVQRVNYKKEGGIKEGEVYFKEEGKSWEWKSEKIKLNTIVEDEARVKEVPIVLWVDPISDDEVGKSSEQKNISLGLENPDVEIPNSYVLGASTVRIRREGSRYIFSTTRFDEHWIFPLWRSLKSSMRNFL